MDEKVEVTKIVIKMGDKDAELSIEQARQLKDALNELLGEKERMVYIPSPYIIERHPYYPRPYWGVTWNSNGTQTGTMTYSLKS